jgi:hydroxymethylpyrimidine pyrophosphatase-like HAD family hydrolase
LDPVAAQEVLASLDVPVDILDNGIIRSRGSLTCDDEPVHAYHLVPRGVSKAQAIALDLSSRGLGAESAVAIGDSLTDLEMGDAVGLMALVGNALDSPSLVRALHRHTPANLVATCCPRSDGWAEFASAWLDARA